MKMIIELVEEYLTSQGWTINRNPEQDWLMKCFSLCLEWPRTRREQQWTMQSAKSLVYQTSQSFELCWGESRLFRCKGSDTS
jgi:hypothetical protein